MGACIRKIEYFLPESILTNKMLEKEFSNWNAEKIEAKTGIKERHVAGKDETALDLAYNCAKKILENYDKDKIDFLILCTQSPEYYLPSGACILQDRLGLKKELGAFDYNLGCSGFIYGLALAKSLINTRMANSVLLITADTYTKYIHPKDKSNKAIFGDGAAATIIERSSEDGIFEFLLGTDGSGYADLIVPNGGLRNKYDVDAKVTEDTFNNFRADNNLYMNGPEIFNFTINLIPKAISKILEKNKMSIGKIDYVIFHQANRYMLEYLRKKIDIPEGKFYINLLHTGNTVSATIPIAIKDCLDKGIVAKGHKILIVGFGVGYSWGATIIRI